MRWMDADGHGIWHGMRRFCPALAYLLQSINHLPVSFFFAISLSFFVFVFLGGVWSHRENGQRTGLIT